MEEKEIWKIYKVTKRSVWEVSNYGNIKRNSEIYICTADKHGYLCFGGHFSVHQAVTTLFLENPNNYNEVDHIDGNRQNNFYLNLRWCTHKQNCNNPITKKRLSEANKEFQARENNPFYGKSHTKESKAKMSAAKKGHSWFIGSDGKRHWE